MNPTDVPTSPTDASSLVLPDAAKDIRRVVIATDDGDDELARVRRVALALARTHGFEVVLYDRSNERWTDHPHPQGPLTADQLAGGDELEGGNREHLVRQLREFEVEGVSASAWLATVPALTAMLDVVQAMDVDAVMLPDRLDDPKIMDRLQVGGTPGEMLERITARSVADAPLILTVPESGPITVVEYSESGLGDEPETHGATR
ncbi:MAG: hypothetical protein WBP59_12005 [Ilumatobacteraceae bacterium]